MTFNLIDEPWLPCATEDGRVVELSLREAFARAPQLNDLVLAAPGQRVALLRLLVAVHQAALRGPSTTDALRSLLKHGRFGDDVDRYLDRWHERFELLDAARPFFQPAVEDGVEPTSVATLVLDWSSGNNTTLVDHHRDDQPPALTPAEAARALVAAQALQLGGGKNVPFNRRAAPLVGCLVGSLAGRTLFETMVLNGVPYDPRFGRPVPVHSTDLPCWERDEDRTPHPDGTTPEGWLDLLTWQACAIRLLADGDGAVRRCVIHQHLALAKGTVDPHIPMHDRDGELVRVRPSEGRALWRQADSILLGFGGGASDRHHGLFSDIEELLDAEYVTGIDVAGLVGSQAKVSDWSSARFPVSSRVARDPDVGVWIDGSLARATQVAGAIRRALRNGGEAIDVHWEELYWGRLRSPFERLLRVVIGDGDVDELAAAWDEELRAAAHDALGRALAVDVATPAAFEREAHARRRLRAELTRILPREVQEAA